MRVQAEPSEMYMRVDGALCRVWNAVTEDGEQMFLFVVRSAIPITAASALKFFDEHGIETAEPSMEVVQGEGSTKG